MTDCPHCGRTLSLTEDWMGHSKECRSKPGTLTVTYGGVSATLDPLADTRTFDQARRDIDSLIWRVGLDRLLAKDGQ